MKCINCKADNRGSDSIEVMHQGVEIGFVCDDCLRGVNGFRLYIVRKKDGTMSLREIQVIPNPR